MTYKAYNLELLRNDLIRHESWENKAYTDTVGKLSIGVGHNLDDLGLSDDVIDIILLADIDDAEKALDKINLCWREIKSGDRQLVLLNMAFNLGETRLRSFKKMWFAIERAQYDVAADEMVDSKWYGQVGIRAVELVRRMRAG